MRGRNLGVQRKKTGRPTQENGSENWVFKPLFSFPPFACFRYCSGEKIRESVKNTPGEKKIKISSHKRRRRRFLVFFKGGGKRGGLGTAPIHATMLGRKGAFLLEREKGGKRWWSFFFQFCLFLVENCFELGRTPNRRKKTRAEKETKCVCQKERSYFFLIGKSMGNMTFEIIVFYASRSSKAPRE